MACWEECRVNPFSSPNEYELCLNCGGLGIVQDESSCLYQCNSCGGNELVLNPFYIDGGLERICVDWVIRPEEWEVDGN